MNFWGFILEHWLRLLFGLIAAILTAGYTRLWKHIKEDMEKNKAMHEGVKALLGNEIMSSYSKYMDKGYCPIYAKRETEVLYTKYQAMKGNGTIKELYNQLLAMPTEKEGK